MTSSNFVSTPPTQRKDVPKGRETRDRTLLTEAGRATRPFLPVLTLTILLLVVASITQAGFLTLGNIQNLLVAVSVLWVIALGQTFALLTGGADLSSGSIAVIVAVIMVRVLTFLPPSVAVLFALVAGTLIGAVLNGVPIGRWRLSFFVVTLGSGTALAGVITLWTGGNTANFNVPFVNWLVLDSHLGIDGPIWIMAITFALAYFVQRFTYFGRNVYAVGGSMPAARLSGIRVERTVIAVFAVCGFCAALGGVIATGLTNAVDPSINSTLALEAIAAALLGGTKLYGGSGSVVGTAFGVLFLGVLSNALNLAGINPAWQDVVTGVILVAAVAGNKGTFRYADVLRFTKGKRVTAD